ncbi:hypothetical protein [Deinococcus aluminii]|uniref:Uncharacterized protein n=1 Tax=Deinococcus aluminii TaxID=1656885 RepID=A0ABP9XHF7_9DEIO
MKDRPQLQVGHLHALRPDSAPRWRVTAILHRGRTYDDVLLEHLEDPELLTRARIYHPGLDPTDLTLPALVRLLDQAYRADQGRSGLPLTDEDRRCLADYLACHDLVREAAWDAWAAELGTREQDEARYWLDLTLMDPAPEDAPLP